MILKDLVQNNFLKVGDRLTVREMTIPFEDRKPEYKNLGSFTVTIVDEVGSVLIEKGILSHRDSSVWEGRPLSLRTATKLFCQMETWGDCFSTSKIRMPNMKTYWFYEDYDCFWGDYSGYHCGKPVAIPEQEEREHPRYKPLKRLFELHEKDCIPDIHSCSWCVKHYEYNARVRPIKAPDDGVNIGPVRDGINMEPVLYLPIYNRNFTYIHVYESREYDKEENVVYGRIIRIVPNAHFRSMQFVTKNEKTEINRVLNRVLSRQINNDGGYRITPEELLTGEHGHPCLRLKTAGYYRDIFNWAEYQNL